MRVVTFGSGTTIFATVLYLGVAQGQPTERKLAILLCSKETDSVGCALEGLLELTGRQLRKQWDDKAVNETGCQTVADKAGFYAFPSN